MKKFLKQKLELQQKTNKYDISDNRFVEKQSTQKKKQEKINNLLAKIDYNCTTLRLKLNKEIINQPSRKWRDTMDYN